MCSLTDNEDIDVSISNINRFSHCENHDTILRNNKQTFYGQESGKQFIRYLSIQNNY